MKNYIDLVAVFQSNMEQTNNDIVADVLVNVLIEFEQENGEMMPESKIYKKLTKRGVSYDELISSIEKRITKQQRKEIIFKGDWGSVDSKEKEYERYAASHNVGKPWTKYDSDSDDYLLHCYEYK